MNSSEVVRQFIERINQHDVDALCELMSEDHRFIDSLGAVFVGREPMRVGWAGYFKLFPDYEIACEALLQQESLVLAYGTARGTYCHGGELLEENRWQLPAAWAAMVSDGLVTEWRVFADNDPVRQLMAKK